MAEGATAGSAGDMGRACGALNGHSTVQSHEAQTRSQQHGAAVVAATATDQTTCATARNDRILASRCEVHDMVVEHWFPDLFFLNGLSRGC